MSRKSFCYKTFENYDKPRDQLKSFCKSGAKSGYYNISSTRGICNDGQCRVKENFQSGNSSNGMAKTYASQSFVRRLGG